MYRVISIIGWVWVYNLERVISVSVCVSTIVRYVLSVISIHHASCNLLIIGYLFVGYLWIQSYAFFGSLFHSYLKSQNLNIGLWVQKTVNLSQFLDQLARANYLGQFSGRIQSDNPISDIQRLVKSIIVW